MDDLHMKNAQLSIQTDDLNDLKTLQDVVEGMAIIAKTMGLSDILGIMRSQLPLEADSQVARKIRLALDACEVHGVSTAEPDLNDLFDIPVEE